MSIKITILSFLFCVFVASAQIAQKPETYPIVEFVSPEQAIELPKLDVGKLRTEDSLEALQMHYSPRFAYAHKLNLNTNHSGKWIDLPNGKLWQLSFKGNFDYTMSVIFANVEIPEGAYIYVYNPKNKEKAGPFTQESLFKNKLSVHPIRGNELVIEYFVPIPSSNLGYLEIESVAEAYRDVFNLSSSFKKGFNSSGSCNNNVVCPEGDVYEDQINSSILVIKGGGTRWCSGCMIGNTDTSDTPYLLSAYHCVDQNDNSVISSSEYADLANWVIMFNYESPDCSPSADGPLTNSISGVSLVASYYNTDVSLLELSSIPPASYVPFYAGWDRSTTGANNAFCVHHPSGDVKKISFENDPVIESTRDANFWRVVAWDDGVTEGGSSGSPLFNENAQVVGQLLGGFSSCASQANGDPNDDWDEYGRFDVSWVGDADDTTKLAPWLDPTGTNATSIDGYYIHSLSSDSNAFDYEFKMYPNPILDKKLNFSVFFKDSGEKGSVEFFDNVGRKVLEVTCPNNIIKYVIDLRNLSEGHYFVKATFGENIVTDRILVY
ncbi:MAG: trypsin-like peptidase domain-containing protein [Bacteroidia bacterium]